MGVDLEEVVKHLEGLLLVVDVEAEVEFKPEKIKKGRDFVAKSALRKIGENRRWFLELSCGTNFTNPILMTTISKKKMLSNSNNLLLKFKLYRVRSNLFTVITRCWPLSIANNHNNSIYSCLHHNDNNHNNSNSNTTLTVVSIKMVCEIETSSALYSRQGFLHGTEELGSPNLQYCSSDSAKHNGNRTATENITTAKTMCLYFNILRFVVGSLQQFYHI